VVDEGLLRRPSPGRTCYGLQTGQTRTAFFIRQTWADAGPAKRPGVGTTAHWQGTRDHDGSQNIAPLLRHIKRAAPLRAASSLISGAL